ncbi:hypothetical protein KP509_03G075200 [Ceratopteris richardii]|uniref:Ribosomal protein L34e superfamily protein n=1 Tax=Ceratopteris richardii TaxID=49495 RepID=A0A8T2V570_CERRI|nr:hypothetical protein KP509_03G075200 [Ceratopteris richardii]
MVVDCRSLIEFCKAFERYRSMTSSLSLREGTKQNINGSLYSRSNHKKQLNGAMSHASLPYSSLSSSPSSPVSPPFCDKSSAAAVDVIILMLVIVAGGFLFTPYLKYLCTQAVEIMPLAVVLLDEVVYQVPAIYIAGVVLMFTVGIAGWELMQHKARKCDNPKCRGLRKAVEFDIQLESEKCVKSMGSSSSLLSSSSSFSTCPTVFTQEAPWKSNLDLGGDQKELEAELRRMAPPNGRAVLIFRLPCGCPIARMEVWGPKKPRKSKK